MEKFIINDKFIKYILYNELKIKNRLSLFLITDECIDNAPGISKQKTGREAENSIIKKLVDEDYVFKSQCLKCVEKLYKDMQPIERDIMIFKFRYKYSSERVGYEVGYSRSNVDNIIRKQKDKLKNMLRDIKY